MARITQVETTGTPSAVFRYVQGETLATIATTRGREVLLVADELDEFVEAMTSARDSIRVELDRRADAGVDQADETPDGGV